MTKLLLKITRFINQKSTIKMLAVILIVGIFFFHHTYAATEDGILNDTQNRLDKGVGFLSWVWIFLAIIAGKLMTNDVVYGAFMHLDKYLRDIWNVMKNFANFGLAAMILYSIVKFVVGGDKADDPKKIIVNALIAGVLIQMSWFMVGALVDLSTIATSAVAGFPSNFIDGNSMITNVQGSIREILAKPQYVAKIVDGKFKREAATARSDGGTCGIDNADGLDAILPKYDSVSGPLIFIGMSFFKVQNYMSHGVIPDTIAGGGQLIVNLALKFIILLAYTLCLLGLIIANLVRILFLRILIMISPIAILMGVFGKEMKGNDGISKYFTIPIFLDLIFKPVFFIGFIGLTLIFVSSMQQIMGGGKGIKDMGGIDITVTTGASKIDMPGLADFQINGDVFGGIADGTKTVFVDLMLIVVTMLLLWKMLRRSTEFGEGPIKDVMGMVNPLVERFVGSLPIVPTPGGDVGLSSLKLASKQSTEKMLDAVGIKGRIGSSDFGKFKAEEDFQKRINEKFLGIAQPWNEQDYKKLTELISTGADKEVGKTGFFETLQQFGSSGRAGGLSLDTKIGSKTVKDLIDDRFKQYNTSNHDVILKKGFRGTYASFDDFFGGESDGKINRGVLHEFLGGPSNEEHKRTSIPDLATLKTNRYYVGNGSTR